MRISDLFSMCVRNLSRRKFRTSMTMIGVVIGTCAIISMISMGLGINKSNSDLISSWGDLSIIDVYGWNPEASLNDEALSTIAAMDGVDAVTPFMSIWLDGYIEGGRGGRYKMERLYSLTGVYPEALEKFGYALSEGEYITEQGGKKIQLLFGQNVAYQFVDSKRKPPNNQVSPYPNERGEIPDAFVDPIKDTFTLVLPYNEEKSQLTYDIEVKGVLAAGDLNSYETQYNIYIDVRDFKRIQEEYNKAAKIKQNNYGYGSNSDSYDQVRVKAANIEDVAAIQQSIIDMGFETHSLEGERQDAMKQTQSMQMILAALGGISLFVAAISIANTMVMSVYERTREIGVMKVLGCLVSNIRSIFLIEAAMIGFFGGVLGVGLSYLISFLLNTYGGAKLGESLGLMTYGMEGVQLSIIPPWLVLLGMGFATMIGIVSGIFPAYRAVRISALEAIKQE